MNHYFTLKNDVRLGLEFSGRQIPVERFVEYEPEDLQWMIPLGMAPEKELDRERAAQIAQQVQERIELDVFLGIKPGSRWPR